MHRRIDAYRYRISSLAYAQRNLSLASAFGGICSSWARHSFDSFRMRVWFNSFLEEHRGQKSGSTVRGWSGIFSGSESPAKKQSLWVPKPDDVLCQRFLSSLFPNHVLFIRLGFETFAYEAPSYLDWRVLPRLWLGDFSKTIRNTFLILYHVAVPV